MCSVESACYIVRPGPRPFFCFRRREQLRLFLKKAMVLPKTAGGAKRGYVKTSGITRGDAKPKPAVQSSNLERFGFWTKPCESAAATTPAESQSTKPHVEASATPSATPHVEASVPAAQWNPIGNLDCQVRCPNPGCHQKTVGIPSKQRKVDLQLMVFFYPRRADNRTFRPPVTQKQKNILNFRKC